MTSFLPQGPLFDKPNPPPHTEEAHGEQSSSFSQMDTARSDILTYPLHPAASGL